MKPKLSLILFILLACVAKCSYSQDSLYTSLDIPPTPTTFASDGPVEIGTVFNVSVSGMITAVRYYTSASGNYIARIWSSTPEVIGQQNFVSNGRGWQRIQLSQPVPVHPGSEYTVSIMAPKNYDSKSQGLATPITKGNLTGIKGTHTDFEGTFPTNVYDKVSYMITPVFEQVHPLILNTKFKDTLLRWPTDSVQLGATVSGDGVVSSWRLVYDPNGIVLNGLNPWVKKMNRQYYEFIITARDKWGNVMTDTSTVAVIQPVIILLSDNTFTEALSFDQVEILREYLKRED